MLKVFIELLDYVRKLSIHVKNSGNNEPLSQAIETHDNNFDLLRLIASSSVIFFHAFALSPVAVGIDPFTKHLLPHISLGGLAVGGFFLISGIFVTQSGECLYLL